METTAGLPHVPVSPKSPVTRSISNPSLAHASLNKRGLGVARLESTAVSPKRSIGPRPLSVRSLGRSDSIPDEYSWDAGPFTKRGHEACSEPPVVNRPHYERILKQSEKIENCNILRCHDTQGLEQGIYIISRPLEIDPTNTPEGRHNLFLQVYQDPSASADIDRAQADYDRLKEALKDLDPTSVEQNDESEMLEELQHRLEATKLRANRAFMLEVIGPGSDASGKRGSKINITSMDHGDAIKPRLCCPYTVVSPVLTRSDVEKVSGAKWVDPDYRSVYSASIERIRKIPYFVLGDNCKVAALQWVGDALDAMPGLTNELLEFAQANMDKPINADVPLPEILKNHFSRNAKAAAVFFKRIVALPDELPRIPIMNGFQNDVNSQGVKTSPGLKIDDSEEILC